MTGLEQACAGALAAELPWAAMRRLLDLGVPARFAAGLNLAGDLSFAGVTIEAGGARWSADGPERRLLLAVREQDQLVDVAALSSTAPDEWALLTGEGAMLGLERVIACQCGLADRLRLFATPLDWLRAGGAGVCVLDWGAAALGWLRGVGPGVVLETPPGAADNLRAALAHGGLPRVEVARRPVSMAA